MELLAEPEAYRRACEQARAAGRRVALVPTMGALHAGHLRLVSRAKEIADFVAVSVFVNPTQFGPGEDLERYPRSPEADQRKCEEAGVDVVFSPAAAELYGAGEETRVRVGATAAALCGRFRPVHFEGVCTVVTKLLGLTGPCVAVFGRKDYQQYRVICRLVADLFLPAEVVGVATVREADGLALSSRNAYLTAAERRRARVIPRSLSAAVAAFADGERRTAVLREVVHRPLSAAADSVDYVQLADAATVQPLADGTVLLEEGPALLALAATFGATRLIDNVVLGEDPAPVAGG